MKNRVFIKLQIIVVLFFISTKSFCNTFYVDATKNGTGLSWATAFQTLDQALAAAKADVGVSEVIYVATGTYNMNGSSYTFTNKSLNITGGYPSGGGSYNASANLTVINMNNTNPNPALIVINNTVGSGFAVTIQGFTEYGIQNNSWDFFDAKTVGETGTIFSFIDMIHTGTGALPSKQQTTYNLQNLNNTCLVHFNNCSFNTLTGGNTGYGAAITLINSAVAPTLTTCTFNNGSLYQLGASASGMIYLSQNTPNPIIIIQPDCIFQNNNNINGQYGAVFNLDQNTGSFVLTGISNSISGNQGKTAAFLATTNNGNIGTITFTNNTFTNNTTSNNGNGGIISITNAGGAASVGNITLTGNTFTSNSVGNAGNGGVIYLDKVSTLGTLTLSNDVFTSNVAGQGGVIYNAGSNVQGSISISNCQFINNMSAQDGGAIYTNTTGSTSVLYNITNSVFTGNNITNNGNGGVINSRGNTSFNIIGSNFCTNTASTNNGNGGVIYFNGNNTNSAISISTSVLNNNTSAGANGGAIDIENASSVVFNNTTFYANAASGNSSNGGAVYTNIPGSTVIPSFTFCSFYGNFSNIRGGAVATNQNGLNLSGCNFTKNYCYGNNTAGGAIYAQLGGGNSLSIPANASGGTIFDQNYTSSASGGGNGGGAIFCNQAATINGAVFHKNYVNNSIANITASGADIYPNNNNNLAISNSYLQQAVIAANYGTGLGSGNNANGNTAGFTPTSPPANCSSIFLILPITVTDFIGNKTSAGNTLSWHAENENSNVYFELQRNSGNGFTTIATLPINQSGKYNFIDANNDGTIYYRIAIVNANGEVQYSNTIIIPNISNRFKVNSIYPIPASTVLNVAIYAPISTNVSYTILDVSGRVISKQLNNTIGANVFSVDISHFSKGTYFLNVEAMGTKITTKFAKF